MPPRTDRSRRFSIGLSSGRCGRYGRAGLVGPVISQQSPEDVDAAASQRQDRLIVPFAFSTFSVVEGSGFWTASDADQRGCVEDALQLPVVALGPVEVAADTTRVPRCRGQTCVTGQAIGGGECRRVTAGGGKELGAEQNSDAGHAQDHRGGVVAVKPALAELVGWLDL